ncbi:MAG: hypothetical protein A2087_05240 [Spirochaetes bacterium GWD1_61_31]|nr:MAG: hypothetical protein A2Y37_10695 [Spirochaetes bacterium GWB1_60_80]OHD29787.1 MAG: hypothetical protein A2004_04970 [Spirochaetes bacterium GWC1_61_12]OHD42871.1 MAG: hypothetical protein A2Y35_13820 [Spirochaetes bacterium GWE1_60_18]OHD43448.1 MAG: hypothetical protein A2087_05240 [Spirochaetes bacterium GWD1_61_31]OHD59591.1 MAG: hypothetical protein A2Y32_12735 [Spirochaetes bacterium GWF1_60_12]HAP43732.1 hypothetical protein [Spirochaetaceae bacterium]
MKNHDLGPEPANSTGRLPRTARLTLAGFLIAGLILACGHSQPSLREYAATQPALQLASYPDLMDKPVIERLVATPAFYINYLQTMDGVDDYRPYEPDAAERRLFAETLALLPPVYQTCLQEHLAIIFFVENFKGGGMADFAMAADGSFRNVLIINPQVLKTGLGDWIARRDNSSFATGPYSIGNRLGNDYRGLVHLLLHEASHIYDYHYYATPCVGLFMRELGFAKLESTEFSRQAWQGFNTPTAVNEFASRNELTAYGLGQASPNAAIPSRYEALAHTSFASLYGSWNWAEDFAEMAAWYCISRLPGINYTLILRQDGVEVASWQPLDKPGMAARLALVSRLLGQD